MHFCRNHLDSVELRTAMQAPAHCWASTEAAVERAFLIYFVA